MTDASLPAEAIQAAAQVFHDAVCTCGDFAAHIAKPVGGDWPVVTARAALAAAAPLIADRAGAAERAGIIKLARGRAAQCRDFALTTARTAEGNEAYVRAGRILDEFADLLGGDGDQP